jgi:hypothetical protein
MARLEPFDPKKHKPIRTVGDRYATEYLASEDAPDNGAWNIPTIWFNTETKEPVFLEGDKAWNTAFEYEKETGKKFPRFKDKPTAVKAAEKRSDKGGASEKKLTRNEGGDVSDQTEKAFSSNPFKGKQTVKRLKNVARNVPVLGTAFDIADIASSVATGNLGQAAVDTGLALAGTTPVGRVLSKTIKKSLNKARSKFKDKFKIDNPDDIYDPTDKKIKSYGQMYADEVKKDTEEKIKKKELKPEQLEDYVNTHGNLYKITGFIKGQEPIPFHPLELINAKGVKGEHKYRDNSPQLSNLKKRIKKEGYKPDPIHVIIDERGRPFVMEGNHRLAEAIQSGRNRIDVELQYLRGGENVDGPFSPKNLGLKSEMAKGGAMLNQQMEMAFMQDGGLQDEGGTVDKESGNDVPSGSLKKEVRDDVPAMLSEGEFVFPADVVRFIGLNKLMEMRQQAKMGLQMMEKMGQMGNSEEAEIPDDLPFGVADIVVMDSNDDDKKEMAQGGVIHAQEGTDVSAPFMNNPSISSPPPREPKEGFEWFATRSGWIERPINTNQGPTNQQASAIGSAVGQLAGFGGGQQPQQGVGAIRYDDGIIDNSAMMDIYNRGQQQQTDFEKMMGYGAGQGSNPYGAQRVSYTKADGSTVNILEDYMGRPMESTEGLTRSTPHQAGPVIGGDTPAGGGGVDPVVPPTPPTPDDGSDEQARREERKKENRKKKRLEERNELFEKLGKENAEKLGMSYDEYRGIDPETGEYKSFSERMKMAKADLAGRPDWAKQDFQKLVNDLPDDVKNIPTVIEAIGKKFKMAGKKAVHKILETPEEKKKRKKRDKAFFSPTSKNAKQSLTKSEKEKKDERRKKATEEAKKQGKKLQGYAGGRATGGLMKRDYP